MVREYCAWRVLRKRGGLEWRVGGRRRRWTSITRAISALLHRPDAWPQQFVTCHEEVHPWSTPFPAPPLLPSPPLLSPTPHIPLLPSPSHLPSSFSISIPLIPSVPPLHLPTPCLSSFPHFPPFSLLPLYTTHTSRPIL